MVSFRGPEAKPALAAATSVVVALGAAASVAFTLLTCTLILEGASLLWPAGGVALLWMRVRPAPALVGAVGGATACAFLFPVVSLGAPFLVPVAMGIGIGVTDFLIRRGEIGTLETEADVRTFVISAVLGSVCATAFLFGSLLLRGDPLGTSAEVATSFIARFSTGVALFYPAGLLRMEGSRQRSTSDICLTALGCGVVAVGTFISVRLDSPAFTFLGVLGLPLLAWITTAWGSRGAALAMGSGASGLLVSGLLFSQYNPTPILSLALTWSMLAVAGTTLLFVAAMHEDRSVERQRQRETAEQLTLALEATEDRVWDWDVEGKTVRVARPSTVRDDTSEITMGIDNWESEIHPGDIDDVVQRRRALFGGTLDRLESEHRVASLDGTWRWITERGRVIERSADGRPLRVVGTARDVTAARNAVLERQALEQRMAQSQRLESLGVLAGGVAHDFNNLLLAMLGNIELVLEEGGDHEALIDARDAALAARELSTQLLAYAGQRPTALSPNKLSSVMGEVKSLLRASVPEAIHLHTDFENAPPILADVGQVRQVILNLVINAAEAIGDGNGSIDIRTGTEFITGDDADRIGAPIAGEMAWVEVRDSGAGMDEYTLDRIFDPFYTTKFQGRGLGLAAVLGIVRAHHGALRVRSKVGDGTSIRVYLIAAPETEADASATPAATNKKQRVGSIGRVVVADDEPAIRRTLARALSRRGYDVVLCEDGSAALDAIREPGAACHLAILDVVMPKMTGRDAFRELRADAPDLPVILMSGYDKDDPESDTGGFTPSVYLQKPFSLRALDDALAEIEASRAPLV